MLKVCLLLYLCAWAVLMFMGVTLWRLAVGAGLLSNIENFITELGALESFKIHGDQIFRIAAVGGLLFVVALTGLTVLGSVVFNLISDIIGGVRFTVVEEETARPRARRTGHRILVAAPPPQAHQRVVHALPKVPPASGRSRSSVAQTGSRDVGNDAPLTDGPHVGSNNPSVDSLKKVKPKRGRSGRGGARRKRG